MLEIGNWEPTERSQEAEITYNFTYNYTLLAYFLSEISNPFLYSCDNTDYTIVYQAFLTSALNHKYSPMQW